MIGANGKPGFIFLIDQLFFIHYVLLIVFKTATKTQSWFMSGRSSHVK